MALSSKALIVSGLVGTAGVVLVEIGRRERSPVMYMAGAGIVAWTIVDLARVLVGPADASEAGTIVREIAPGEAEV